MSMLPIKFLTVHCAATPEGLDVKAKQVEQMDINRPDIGRPAYHLIIELDGTVHRSYPDDVKGAHVANHNTGNIGVCYVGGLDRVTKQPKDTRTPAQKKALADLLKQYQAKYPGIELKGHRDWSPDLNNDGKLTPNEWIKACPCFDVKGWVKAGFPLS